MTDHEDRSADSSAVRTRDREVVEHLPDGVAVLESGATILWANDRLTAWCGIGDLRGRDLVDAVIGTVDQRPDEALAFHEALLGGRPAAAILRTAANHFFAVHACPSFMPADLSGGPRTVVTVREVTQTILEQQKRAAIHAAGQTLADLSPAELADMTIHERIELLKSNIIHYAKDLLQFEDRKSVV